MNLESFSGVLQRTCQGPPGRFRSVVIHRGEIVDWLRGSGSEILMASSMAFSTVRL